MFVFRGFDFFFRETGWMTEHFEVESSKGQNGEGKKISEFRANVVVWDGTFVVSPNLVLACTF